MKQRKLLLVSCLPLIVLVIGGLVWGFGARGTSKPVTGRVETVTRGEVAIRVTETGVLEPLKKVEVKSKVAGKIERLFVSEGSRVAAGQLLVLVDPTEINSQVAQMQAQLDGARARLRQAQRGVGFQSEQTVTGVQQAEEALQSALARLQVARDEYAAQPARTRSDLAQAQAGLEATRNSLALLKEATQPQAVVQARTNLDEAEAALVEARSQVERNEKLLAKGFVAQQAVDSARTALASASARRDQAKARLDLLGNQSLLEIAEAENRVAQARATLDRARADRSLQTRRQELLSAEAAVRQARSVLRAARANTQQDRMRGDEVEQARAQVTQLENSLREVAVRQTDTRILAPMSGTVTHRYIEEGELVTSGVSAFSSGQPVLQIADLSRMLVNLNVNEVDVQRIRPGLPAEVAVDGVRGVRFAARVRKVAPAAAGGGAAAAGGRGGGQGVLGGGGRRCHPLPG
jgi:HlyD family secretion protein